MGELDADSVLVRGQRFHRLDVEVVHPNRVAAVFELPFFA